MMICHQVQPRDFDESRFQEQRSDRSFSQAAASKQHPTPLEAARLASCRGYIISLMEDHSREMPQLNPSVVAPITVFVSRLCMHAFPDAIFVDFQNDMTVTSVVVSLHVILNALDAGYFSTASECLCRLHPLIMFPSRVAVCMYACPYHTDHRYQDDCPTYHISTQRLINPGLTRIQDDFDRFVASMSTEADVAPLNVLPYNIASMFVARQ